MQKNTTNLSDRFRGILSDLSSFIGKDTSSAASPVCESHDRDSFIKRLHSFKSSSWFAKPCWLSPVICARYGWMNVDVDLLQCVGCQSVLFVRSPTSFDPVVYSACQKRLEDQLKRTAHHACCIWSSCPTPEGIIFAHSNSASYKVVADKFITKSLLLHSAGKDLPAVEHSSLNLSDSDVTALCSLVTDSPRFQHDADIPGAVRSAILLALAGWDLSDGGRAVPGCTSIQCTLCMRQPGLWNYISIAGGGDVEPNLDAYGHGDFVSDTECNADKESGESETSVIHSPCNIVENQLSPYQVTDMQLATGGTDLQAAIDDPLPFDTNIDVQESLVLAQDIEAMDELQDRLPSIDSQDVELNQVAVSSDKDDGSEAVTDDMTDDHFDANPHESLSGFRSSGSHSSTSPAASEPELHTDVAENLVSHEIMECYDSMQQELDVPVLELNTIDSDSLDASSESDNTSDREESAKESDINAADTDAEKAVSNFAGTSAMHDVHGRDLDSSNKFIGSHSMEEDAGNSSYLEDFAPSLEPPISAVDYSGAVSSKMRCSEEVVHETTDSLVEPTEQNEDNVDTNSQESVQQPGDVDTCTQAAALDLTVSAGGLQQDGSFTGESKQNVDADISEDIRYLVTELIDELVADAEDSSVAEFVQQNEACIESDVQESIQQSADVDEEAAMLADLSNRLQRDVSADGLNGPTVQADISEDVRGLLTELIGDVVEAAESPTDSTTRKSSKRRASDVPLAEPEPSHKRRPFGIVVRRTAFNPVSEHHHWCPYICGIANDGSGDVGGCKPWLRLLRQLVPDAEAALSRVQTSPAPNGIDRIRKLFRAWTSTT